MELIVGIGVILGCLALLIGGTQNEKNLHNAEAGIMPTEQEQNKSTGWLIVGVIGAALIIGACMAQMPQG